MQLETTPRSFPPGHPSRARITSHLAAFSGDRSFSSSANYYLTRDSRSGSQNYSAGNRQSIDLSSEPSSSTSHHHSDLPWTPLDVTESLAKATTRQTRPTSSTGIPRTPNNPIDTFGFQYSGFHDSAIGTTSGPSQDERQTVLSSTIADMDPTYGWHPRMEPREVQPQGEEEDEQDLDEQAEEDETESQFGPENVDPTRHKPKTQRQARTTAELTCTVPGCGTVSKTPSDFKYDDSSPYDQLLTFTENTKHVMMPLTGVTTKTVQDRPEVLQRSTTFTDIRSLFMVKMHATASTTSALLPIA